MFVAVVVADVLRLELFLLSMPAPCRLELFLLTMPAPFVQSSSASQRLSITVFKGGGQYRGLQGSSASVSRSAGEQRFSIAVCRGAAPQYRGLQGSSTSVSRSAGEQRLSIAVCRAVVPQYRGLRLFQNVPPLPFRAHCSNYNANDIFFCGRK